MTTIKVELHGSGGDRADIEVGSIVSMTKRHDIDSRDPPTQVNLDEGSVISSDSMLTIIARAGDAGNLAQLLGVRGEWPITLCLDKVAYVIKRDEDQTEDEDPSEVHMSDGQALLTADSIRTIQAIMSLRGIRLEPMDVVGTMRPAAVVPGHIQSRFETTVDGETKNVLLMPGGKLVTVNDDLDRFAAHEPKGPGVA